MKDFEKMKVEQERIMSDYGMSDQKNSQPEIQRLPVDFGKKKSQMTDPSRVECAISSKNLGSNNDMGSNKDQINVVSETDKTMRSKQEPSIEEFPDNMNSQQQ